MAIEAPPVDSPALADKPWRTNQDWVLWFYSILNYTAVNPDIVANLTVSDLAVAINPAETVLTFPGSGLYRLQVLTRVTQAATISSSVQVTIAWTAGGAAQAITGALLNGNTLQTQEAIERLIDADEGTDLTITTTYTSSGATPMQYRTSVILERYP
jgi:hypothetical protein